MTLKRKTASKFVAAEYSVLDVAKRQAVLDALRKCGTKWHAARELRVPESTLYRNIKNLKIKDKEWK